MEGLHSARVRCYDKHRLAQLYFPELSAAAAVDKLRRWIRRCSPLMEELRRVSFCPKSKMFSAREVRLIFYYLGEPDVE
jgi:hypothetical protein